MIVLPGVTCRKGQLSDDGEVDVLGRRPDGDVVCADAVLLVSFPSGIRLPGSTIAWLV